MSQDVSAREPDHVPDTVSSPVMPSPTLDLSALHPESLYNEYTEQVWMRAETLPEALQALRSDWGPGYMSDEDIDSLELEPEWMRPQLLPRDHELYAETVAECGDPNPVWYVLAPEGSLGAALYWRYEP